MAAPHRHADLELNYVRRGRMRYLLGGSVVTVPANRLCLLWGAAAHQTLQGPEAAHWVTIPLSTVLGWQLPETLMETLLGEGFVLEAASWPDDLARLQRWERDLRTGGEENRRIVLLELEARLRRLAMAQASTTEAAAPAETALGPGEAVRRMADFMSRHYRESLTTARIAEAAPLHPNHAMNRFRQETGMTLRQYLTRQRIAHAQRRLATSQDPILEIAEESGFGSPNRFFESFRRTTGTTPRRFRQRARWR